MARTTILLLALFAANPPAAAAAAKDTASPGSPASPPAGEYTVSPEASRVRVLVFRGGLLGGLGHNHVISASRIAGRVRVAEPPSESTVELHLPFSGFEVDLPEARRHEGERFPGTLSADDVAATHENMLGPKLLDAGDAAGIDVVSRTVDGAASGWSITVDVTLPGGTRTLDFPATVEVLGDTITVRGERAVTHGELGLEPFRAALGTLRVKEEMTLKYRIVAVRRSAPE